MCKICKMYFTVGSFYAARQTGSELTLCSCRSVTPLTISRPALFIQLHYRPETQTARHGLVPSIKLKHITEAVLLDTGRVSSLLLLLPPSAESCFSQRRGFYPLRERVGSWTRAGGVMDGSYWSISSSRLPVLKHHSERNEQCTHHDSGKLPYMQCFEVSWVCSILIVPNLLSFNCFRCISMYFLLII